MSKLTGKATSSQPILQAPWDTLRILLGVLLFLLVGISLTSLYPLLRLGGTAIIGLIAVLLLFTKPGFQFKPRALHVIFGALLLFEAVSLLWTPHPSAAAEYLTFHFFLYIFFCSFQALFLGKWKTKNIRDALILLGITFVILDLLLFSAWYRSWLSISSNPFPPIGYRSSGHLLGHPNSLAGFLSLLLPIALTGSFFSEKSSDRWVSIATFLILGTGLFLTSSRGGWLASLAGLGLTFAVLISTWKGWRQAINPRSPSGEYDFRKIIILILVTLAILVVGAAGLWQMSNTGHASPLNARLPVWRGSVQVAESSPVLGSGIRSFPTLFAELPFEYHEEDVPHAHNAFLQFWAELGILGVLLLTALMSLVAWFLFRAYRNESAAGRRKLAPYIGIFTTVFAHQQVDYLFGSPFYSGAILIFLASFLHRFRNSNPKAPISLSLRTISTLIITAVFIGLAMLQQENWGHWRAVTSAGDRNWARTSALLCDNNQKYPAAVVSAANCQVARRLVQAKPADFDSDIPKPHELDPNWHLHWQNYAGEMRAANNIDEAVAAQKRAVEIAPDRPNNYLFLGYLLELEGSLAEAEEAYATAIRLNPSLLHSFAFLNSQTSVNIIEHLTDYLTSGSQLKLFEIESLISLGDYRQAVEEMETSINQLQRNYRYYQLLADARMGIGELEKAEQALELASFLQPDHPYVLLSQSRLARMQGDRQLADQLLIELLEDIIFTTQSRQYYFAAYGRATLSVDQGPYVIRGVITPAILEAARDLGSRNDDPEIQRLVAWIIQSSGAAEDD